MWISAPNCIFLFIISINPLPGRATSPGVNCNEDDYGRIKPNPLSCESFYICTNDRKAELMECPVGNKFSLSRLICVRPWLSDCLIKNDSYRITEQSTEPFTTSEITPSYISELTITEKSTTKTFHPENNKSSLSTIATPLQTVKSSAITSTSNPLHTHLLNHTTVYSTNGVTAAQPLTYHVPTDHHSTIISTTFRSQTNTKSINEMKNVSRSSQEFKITSPTLPQVNKTVFELLTTGSKHTSGFASNTIPEFESFAPQATPLRSYSDPVVPSTRNTKKTTFKPLTSSSILSYSYPNDGTKVNSATVSSDTVTEPKRSSIIIPRQINLSDHSNSTAPQTTNTKSQTLSSISHNSYNGDHTSELPTDIFSEIIPPLPLSFSIDSLLENTTNSIDLQGTRISVVSTIVESLKATCESTKHLLFEIAFHNPFTKLIKLSFWAHQ